MRLLLLSLRLLWQRRWAALLSLLLMAAGLACLVVALQAGAQLQAALSRALAVTDAVAGAAGSDPYQLVAGDLLQQEPPTTAITIAALQPLAQDKRFSQVIPLALSDSFLGFRIVGTTPAYLALYGARYDQGQVWQHSLRAVVGAEVARATGIGLNNTFIATHGTAVGGSIKHKQAPLRAVGILAPCNCVLDWQVVTPIQSIWYLHDDSMTEEDLERDMAQADPKREATAALLRHAETQRQEPAAQAPALTGLQTAGMPAGLGPLQQRLAQHRQMLQGAGMALLLLGGLVWLAACNATVRARHGDFALLRWHGAGPAKLAALVLWQAVVLALMAAALGLLGGHAALWQLDKLLHARQLPHLAAWHWQLAEWLVPLLALVVALLAAGWPARHASRAQALDLLLPPSADAAIR